MNTKSVIPEIKNKNYAGMVVRLHSFRFIPKRDRIKHALIFGNEVIVSINSSDGDIGVFFPVECQLSHALVSYINGYQKPEYGNRDLDAKPGFFDENRRVKCLKFSGAKSEGFFIPLSSFEYTGVDMNLLCEGTSFDAIDVNGVRFDICQKYIPKGNPAKLPHNQQQRKKRIDDAIVDGQFRLHYDTDNLRYNTHRIFPSLDISISWKEHGISAVFSDVLVKRELTWMDKVAEWFGVSVSQEKYGFIWSSRKVIKGVDGIEKDGQTHYYGEDVWGYVAKKIEPILPKGYTVYGEIVGYTPSGGAIQSMGGKPYDYGCEPGEHKFKAYRVTVTNADGVVLEMPYKQMIDWCEAYGIQTVQTIFYGKASEFLPVYPGESDKSWQDRFLDKLLDQYVTDEPCHMCKSGVIREGVVVRVDNAAKCSAFKLKSFDFLKGESVELDTGQADIETIESSVEETPA